MNKLGQILTGNCRNVNGLNVELTEQINKISTNINDQIDVFLGGVREDTDYRWSWAPSGSFPENDTISTINSGLAGTSIYSYIGTDYDQVDPIFFVANPEDNTQIRPNTIFETFHSLKNYVDQSITERSVRLKEIVADIVDPYDVSNFAEGALLKQASGVISECSLLEGTETIESVLYKTYTINGFGLKFGANDKTILSGDTVEVTWNSANSRCSFGDGPSGETFFLGIETGKMHFYTPDAYLRLDADSQKATIGAVEVEINAQTLYETCSNKRITISGGKYSTPAPNHPLQIINADEQTISNGIRFVLIKSGIGSGGITYLPIQRLSPEVWDDGRELVIKNISGFDVDLTCSNDDTIEGSATFTLSDSSIQTLVYESSTETWYLFS